MVLRMPWECITAVLNWLAMTRSGMLSPIRPFQKYITLASAVEPHPPTSSSMPIAAAAQVSGLTMPFDTRDHHVADPLRAFPFIIPPLPCGREGFNGESLRRPTRSFCLSS